MERWQQPGYLEIVRATATPQGRITVLFADETWVEFDGRRLLPPGPCTPSWSALSLNEEGGFLEIPTTGEPIELPADRIRLLTDPDYAEYWATLAAEEAHRVGKRLRALRQRRGLTGREVARRAGIAPMSLSRIELGHHDIVLTTLAKILAALGGTWDDLASSPEAEAQEAGEQGPAAVGTHSVTLP